MLDERLEKHLKGRLDLFQFQFDKEKVDELQKKDNDRYDEILRMIEGGMSVESEDEADNEVFDDEKIAEQIDDDRRFQSLLNDDILMEDLGEVRRFNENHQIEIPDEIEDLISSPEHSGSEDSFDRLIRGEKKLKKPKKPTMTAPVQDLIFTQSPVSSAGSSTMRRSKTFDVGRRAQFGSVNAMSSPISLFLDVESPRQSPVAHHSKAAAIADEDEEIKRIKLKYGIQEPATSTKTALKKTKSMPAKKTAATQKKAQPKPTQSNHVDVEDNCDDLEYVQIDDINPNDYDVILAVDIQETSGKTSANDDRLIQSLNESNVKTDVRKLHIGDFLWIAKHKTDSKELVLPYVIERKRLDDLAQSIKDGRYHEQKFRLLKCGVENIIYVIESMKTTQRGFGLPLSTLMQAATNTQIHSKFQVKFTDSFSHTIVYLTVMTTFIEKIFKNKAPVKFKLIDFTKFNKYSMKQRKLTVREAFMKQLMVLKGLSFDIAVEITKHYPTPYSLYQKYQTLSEKEGENLLNELKIGDAQRKISKQISETIYALYTTRRI